MPITRHHGSHRKLLTRAVANGHAPVDALIVPTARDSGQMREAIDLSVRLDCVLVALCSQQASGHAVATVATRHGAKPIALDVDELPTKLLPQRLETTEMLSGTPFERKTDTAMKRNLGLLLAHAHGWQRIVFLDDDIRVPRPRHLRKAARLLDCYTGVGLSIEGFPDNSVVCHAYRDMGGRQETFIGGGALAVGPAALSSFFPNVYNEDWFFLLGDTGIAPVSTVGRAMQEPYDPYSDPERAETEEFGDCLAEGIFALLDDGRTPRDADLGYWHEYLRTRRKFIEEVIDLVHRRVDEPAQKKQMVIALDAARSLNQLMTPDLCVDFLQAWRDDRARWARHIEKLPREYVLEWTSGVGRQLGAGPALVERLHQNAAPLGA